MFKNKKYKKYILLIILIFYLFITIILSTIKQNLYYNLINPFFWFIFLIYINFYHENRYYKTLINKKIFQYTFIMSFIINIIYFYLGFIFGFSKNPYNLSFIMIVKNIFIELILAIGLEELRYYLIVDNKKKKLLIFIITLLFIFSELNYYQVYSNLFLKKELFKYFCAYFLPLIGSNILFTYLTFKTNSPIQIIIIVLEKLFMLLLPILPNLDWFTIGSIGLLKDMIIYFIFKYIFTKDKKVFRKKYKNSFVLIYYAFTLIFATFLISFMLGLFKYKPITILSNSMSPLYEKGDVVIYKKYNMEELQEIPINSIIVYKYKGIYISHRIVDKIKKNNLIYYVTKGDCNNTVDDDIVSLNQIVGVYSFHIKYIGYPTIWLNTYLNTE